EDRCQRQPGGLGERTLGALLRKKYRSQTLQLEPRIAALQSGRRLLKSANEPLLGLKRKWLAGQVAQHSNPHDAAIGHREHAVVEHQTRQRYRQINYERLQQ